MCVRVLCLCVGVFVGSPFLLVLWCLNVFGCVSVSSCMGLKDCDMICDPSSPLLLLLSSLCVLRSSALPQACLCLLVGSGCYGLGV